jgi:hypothetical protein
MIHMNRAGLVYLATAITIFIRKGRDLSEEREDTFDVGFRAEGESSRDATVVKDHISLVGLYLDAWEDGGGKVVVVMEEFCEVAEKGGDCCEGRKGGRIDS